MREPLFGAGFTAKSVNVTAQSRVNFYADLQPMEDAARIAFYGTPGLDTFSDLGDTPVRGGIEVEDVMYVLHNNTLYEINSIGAATARGTISTTTGRVDMRWSKVAGQVALVDGVNLYVYTISATTLVVVTTNVISNPTSIAWQDGYFIIENGSEFQISALDDATTWDATEVASAESSSDPIIRVAETKAQLVLLGSKSTEFWQNTGAVDFPYERVQGATADWGLAARWSLVRMENSLVGLMRDLDGDVSVRMIAGYQPTPLSTPDVEYEFNNYSTRSDATGMMYRHSGHTFYQVNFPTEGKSWLYDFTSGLWSELKSGASRHRGNISISLNNKTYICDYEDGNIFFLNPDTYTDNGETIISELVSRHLINQGSQDPFAVGSMWVDIEPGVGLTSGQGSDPKAMLLVSKDRGKSWPVERQADMGKKGKYKQRLRWNRFGRSYSFTFKLRISDPVKRVIIGEGWLS